MTLYSIWDSYYPGPLRKQAEIRAYEDHLAALDDDCVRWHGGASMTCKLSRRKENVT